MSADSSDVILSVRELMFRYPQGRSVLHGISFELGRRESVALVGPNGAGKSTLLLHLNGLLNSREEMIGGIVVDGLPLAKENLLEIRRRIGLVFQDPDDQLFCPTVLEDVSFGPLNLGYSSREAKEKALDALRRVGLSEAFSDRPPHQLSVGERKRVCMAGVLACEPSILALDEPTSNLDPRGRRQLIEILRELPLAKIIATHDLEMVLELCPRLLLLDEGKIHADGHSRDLLQQADLMLKHGLEVPQSLAR
ncbi:MAG: ABC transporter ATP-binding protein [Planctomycetota bacterium]